MTRADHLAAVTARVQAARSLIAAEERAERIAASDRRKCAPPVHGRERRPRGGACRGPGCKRRVPRDSRFSSFCRAACQVRAYRARTDARPLFRLVCECGCGAEFETRSTVKRFLNATHQHRGRDRRRYERDPRRREPRGVNRVRAMARIGGAA